MLYEVITTLEFESTVLLCLKDDPISTVADNF